MIYKTTKIKIDIEKITDIIDQVKDQFFCPFGVVDSYLHIFETDGCSAQFYNLQHCDYSAAPSHSGKLYIKTLIRGMQKANRPEQVQFLQDNIERFSVETNESNFNIVGSYPELINDLNAQFGEVCRARFVRLPSGGTMQFHKDETINGCRVIVPIISNPKCINSFMMDEQVDMYLEPDGSYYSFPSDRISHAVFNKSDEDRYVLIFTILGDHGLEYYD